MSIIRCKIPSNSIEWSDPNGKPGRKNFEMENYIMLDGRKFEIDEKSSLLLRAVVGEEKRGEESCFSQACDNPYYFITSCGSVDVIIDSNSFTDDIRYRVGNYCADKNLMSQRNLHETLNRLLWRFSEINGGDENEWDGVACHYYITLQDGIGEKKLVVEWTSQWHHQGVVFFSSILAAERAIEEIVKPFMAEHPEFVW